MTKMVGIIIEFLGTDRKNVVLKNLIATNKVHWNVHPHKFRFD